MKIRLITALLLAFLLAFLAGCNSNGDVTEKNSSTSSSSGKAAFDTVRVLYSSKDTLDPYTCVTEQNAALSQLMFEPLVILNNSYEIEYRLAETVTVTDKLCAIVLRDAKFSDGTSVTPEDVVFSFNKAKKSTTTRHMTALKYADSAKVTGNNTVSITLTRNDPYFANLLTFPIMKKGSDELKDTDNQSLAPIGAGRYVFDNEKATLSQNNFYYGASSVIKNIQTVDCPDNESVDQAITAGMVDIYFTDLLNNVIPKMNGNTADISQTRMVFLGVNPEQPQLANSLFRQAISAAIDRENICSSAYYSKATPALGPMPTAWKPTKGLLSIQSTSNLQTAAQNIELAGFENKNKDGFYTLKNGNAISFSLLVNSENESRVSAARKIADNISAAGIKVTVKEVSEKQYFSLIKSGNYDLYIGEIRFEENMDIGGLISLNSASLLSPLESGESSKKISSKKTSSVSSKAASSASSGSENTSDGDTASVSSYTPGEITLTTADAYAGFYNGEYTLQDLITAFTAELPVIPVCFKNGLVIYSDRFGNGITPSRTDLFHGIQYLK